MVTRARLAPGPSPVEVADAALLCALAAWRRTQGVYRYDPQLRAALVRTPLSGPVPCDLLTRLPEWACLLELGGIELPHVGPLSGALAWLEHDANTGAELRYHVIGAAGDVVAVLVLQLEQGLTVEESAERALELAEREAAKRGIVIDGLPTRTELGKLVRPLVALTLYLCSDEADVAGGGHWPPPRPQPRKTRRGVRVRAAAGPKQWSVGERIGAALRLVRDSGDTADSGDSVIRAGPRPHVRRAHWHTYLTGPRTGEQRRLLRWISPVLVGGDDVVPVVRAVDTRTSRRYPAAGRQRSATTARPKRARDGLVRPPGPGSGGTTIPRRDDDDA